MYAGKPVGEAGPHYVKGTSAIVKSLVRKVSAHVDLTGRNITTDRLYTTYDLTKWFMKQHITTVGTLMANRKGIPKEFHKVNDRDSPSYKLLYDITTQGVISLHSYVVNTKSKGKKNVLLMASQPPLLGVTKDEKKKPGIYKYYDYTKGGTDSMDYRMSANTVKTKSKRWTMSAFAYIMDTFRVNSQTILALSKGEDPRKSDSTDYAWNLAIELAKPHMERRRAIGGLSMYIKRSIDMIIGPEEPRPLVRAQENMDLRKRCEQCLSDLRGQHEYKKKKNKLQKYVTRCVSCHKTVCKAHCSLICVDCNQN